MNKIRESIKLWQFIATSAINIIDTILFFIACKNQLNFHSLKYLTNITLYFNTTYLFLAFICDISFFIFKSHKLESFNYFLRYNFCNIINPILYLVFFLFWVLVPVGGIKGAFDTASDTFFSIYAHLIITILVISELFINDHDLHKFSWITYGFILLYIFCYIIILLLCHAYDIYPYDFLKNTSTIGFICYGILFVALSFGAYIVHIFIFKLKYKYIIKNKEKQDFNDEVNKIIQLTDLSKISTEDDIEYKSK